MQNAHLQAYIQDKKYIFWYVSDISGLSDEAIVEGIIRYGTWEDIKMLFLHERPTLEQSYKKIIAKKRCNLSKKEIYFIDSLLQYG